MTENILTIPRHVAQAVPYMIYFSGLAGTVITGSKLALYFVIGAFLIADVINHFLKLIFKMMFKNQKWANRPEGRPDSGCGIFDQCIGGKSKSFGFPSGHAQITSFSAMFWTLYLLDIDKVSKVRWYKIGALWLTAILVWLSRVAIKCHNLVQILAGAIIGAGLGYVWYMLVKKHFLKGNLDAKW